MKRILFIVLAFCIFNTQFSCNQTRKPIILTYLVQEGDPKFVRTEGVIFINQNPKITVSCTVTNTSDYGGVFRFYETVSSSGRVIEFSEDKYINAGATVMFVETKEIDPFSFKADVSAKWGIVAPTKSFDR